jgi:hypothetical protein
MCCAYAKSSQAYLNKSLEPEDYVCDQKYNPSLLPAPSLDVSYSWCLENCGGIKLSNSKSLSQWATPLLQYIVPSVVFSMSIPRPWMLEFPDRTFELDICRHSESNSAFLSVICLCSALWGFPLSLLGTGVTIIADTALWVICIMVMAGPMLFSGICEAIIDYIVVYDSQSLSKQDLMIRFLAALSGNLDLSSADPEGEISAGLNASEGLRLPDERAASRLLSIMTSQSGFGSAVGAPVLFYVGSFIYTIVDLSNKISDNDTAHALAFGMWWMVILHVALVSGCLLASNNPSTAAAIAGHLPRRRNQSRWRIWSPIYYSRFLPVWMWARGWNKIKWINRTGNNPARHPIILTYWSWFVITIAAVAMVFIPCFLAGWVSYHTPKHGIGCRTLTFLVYFCCQVILILMSLWKHVQVYQGFQPIEQQTPFLLLGFIPIVGAVFSGVAGTLMQIIGAYRSCICSVRVSEWINDPNATVPLASDTLESRQASVSWAITAETAIGFLAVVCYFGWWYQRFIRQNLTDEIEYRLRGPYPHTAAHRDVPGEDIPLEELPFQAAV